MHAGSAASQSFRSELKGIFVLETELAAATGDDSDAPQLSALVPVLNRLRGAFGMEMIFIGQLSDGRLTGREPMPEQACNPFEEAYGRDLLRARCGTSVFDAVSVCSDDGVEAGTLVCGVAANDGYQSPPDSLRSVSRLLASSMRKMKSA